MKFNLEDYKGDYAMHCDTEEKAKVFCNYLHSQGREWCNGKSYKEMIGWERNKKEVVYYLNVGQYAGLTHAKRNGYTILEFDDFEWDGYTPNKYSVPNHYKINGVDVMDTIVGVVKNNTSDITEGVYLFNVLKYLFRYRNKNGVEDLKKAKDYLTRLIDYVAED